MPTVNGKKYPYTREGIKAARAAANDSYGPDAVLRTFCPKCMPKYSNNPRTIQGRQLRKGGTV
tara:strand:- start:810 stop:998 length:189 start_codon:yes stop_codon:yes gene_type:complete